MSIDQKTSRDRAILDLELFESSLRATVPWNRDKECAVLRSQFPGGGSSNEYYTTWLKEDSLFNRYAKAK